MTIHLAKTHYSSLTSSPWILAPRDARWPWRGGSGGTRRGGAGGGAAAVVTVGDGAGAGATTGLVSAVVVGAVVFVVGTAAVLGSAAGGGAGLPLRDVSEAPVAVLTSKLNEETSVLTR